MARLALLLLCASCTAPRAAANVPAGVEFWPPLTKLAFFPVQVRIDVDGAPITPDSLVQVRELIQKETERALAHENLGTRAFFALSEPWQLGAVALGHWLEATPCGRTAPGDAKLDTLLHSVRADAVVYVEVHAFLTRDGVGNGHTVLGKLTGAVGVTTVASVSALAAAAAGEPFVQLAVEHTHAQLVARDLESQRFGPICADHVDVALRDAPDLRTLGEASVTVAVVGADGRLLWFRRGRVPLVFGDSQRAARLLATFVRAEN